VEILNDDNLVHPADALAAALDRASGLLATLVELYDTHREAFVGGNPFVVHALSTTGTLMEDARSALSDLHYACDLTLIEMPHAEEEEPLPMPELKSAFESEPVTPFAEQEQEPELVAEEMPDVAAPAQAPMPSPMAAESAPPDDGSGRQEPFAQSYLELLRKLTAAEVFAAEQQALSAPGAAPELLPLLRGLREEFQKMHNVA
jgi:hypothetical protein